MPSPLIPLANPVVPAMSRKALKRVYDLERVILRQNPSGNLPIWHVFHAGLYARTVMVPANIVITGALIKIPTVLIVQGDCFVTLGDEVQRITGYHVLSASAGRKQAFRSVTDTTITMLFATKATTVEEAEREFTDEWRRLASRKEGAENTVEGADACQV